MEEYPLREFLSGGLLVSVNTDNRTVTGTTVSRELGLLAERFGITKEEGKAVMYNAMDTAFAEESIKQEIRQEITRWDGE